MKKYFIKKDGKELVFGDRVEIDFAKVKDDCITSNHLEGIFCPEMAEILLENDIIGVKEEKKECKCNNETPSYEVEIHKLKKHIEELEDRLTELKGIVADK